MYLCYSNMYFMLFKDVLNIFKDVLMLFKHVLYVI